MTVLRLELARSPASAPAPVPAVRQFGRPTPSGDAFSTSSWLLLRIVLAGALTALVIDGGALLTLPWRLALPLDALLVLVVGWIGTDAPARCALVTLTAVGLLRRVTGGATGYIPQDPLAPLALVLALLALAVPLRAWLGRFSGRGLYLCLLGWLLAGGLLAATGSVPVAAYGLLSAAVPPAVGFLVAAGWHPHLPGFAIRSLLVLPVPVAGYAIWAYYAPPRWDLAWLRTVDLAPIGRPAAEQFRAFGSMEAPLVLALYLGLALIVLIALLVRRRRGVRRAVGGLILPVLVLVTGALLLTGVRSVVFALPLVFLAFICTTRPRHRLRTALALLLVVVAVWFAAGRLGLMPANQGSSRYSLSRLDQDESFQSRAHLLDSFAATLTHPLGSGTGTTGLAKALDNGEAIGVDNGYLTMAVEGGPLRLGLFLLLAGLALRRALGRLSRTDGDLDLLDICVPLALTYYLLLELSSDVTSGPMSLFFWILLGAALRAGSASATAVAVPAGPTPSTFRVIPPPRRERRLSRRGRPGSADEHRTDAQRAVRNIASITLANAVLPVAALATGPVLARVLGPSGRGHATAILAPISLVPLVLAVGQQDAASWLVAARRVPVRLVAVSVGLVGAVGGFLGAAGLWLLAPVLLDDYPAGVPLLRLVSLTLIPALTLNAVRGARLGERRYQLANAERWVGGLSRLALIVGFAAAGVLTVTTASWIQVLVLLLGQGFLLVGLPKATFGRADIARTVRAALRYGVRAWGGEMAALVTLRLDQTIMLPLAGARQLGYYSVAVALAEVPLILLSAARLVLLIEAADRRDAGLVARSTRLLPVLMGLPVLAALFLTPYVVTVLFGADFLPAVPMARLLLLATLPAAFGSLIGGGFASLGRPGVNSVCSILGVVITVPGLLFLVPRFGGMGAAAVSFAAYAGGAILLLVLFARLSDLPLRAFLLPRANELRRLLPGRLRPR